MNPDSGIDIEESDDELDKQSKNLAARFKAQRGISGTTSASPSQEPLIQADSATKIESSTPSAQIDSNPRDIDSSPQPSSLGGDIMRQLHTPPPPTNLFRRPGTQPQEESIALPTPIRTPDRPSSSDEDSEVPGSSFRGSFMRRLSETPVPPYGASGSMGEIVDAMQIAQEKSDLRPPTLEPTIIPFPQRAESRVSDMGEVVRKQAEATSPSMEPTPIPRAKKAWLHWPFGKRQTAVALSEPQQLTPPAPMEHSDPRDTQELPLLAITPLTTEPQDLNMGGVRVRASSGEGAETVRAKVVGGNGIDATVGSSDARIKEAISRTWEKIRPNLADVGTVGLGIAIRVAASRLGMDPELLGNIIKVTGAAAALTTAGSTAIEVGMDMHAVSETDSRRKVLGLARKVAKKYTELSFGLTIASAAHAPIDAALNHMNIPQHTSIDVHIPLQAHHDHDVPPTTPAGNEHPVIPPGTSPNVEPAISPLPVTPAPGVVPDVGTSTNNLPNDPIIHEPGATIHPLEVHGTGQGSYAVSSVIENPSITPVHTPDQPTATPGHPGIEPGVPSSPPEIAHSGTTVTFDGQTHEVASASDLHLQTGPIDNITTPLSGHQINGDVHNNSLTIDGAGWDLHNPQREDQMITLLESQGVHIDGNTHQFIADVLQDATTDYANGHLDDHSAKGIIFHYFNDTGSERAYVQDHLASALEDLSTQTSTVAVTTEQNFTAFPSQTPPNVVPFPGQSDNVAA